MAKDATIAKSDLGRRIAEHRGRAGLSVADAAKRAGMAPGYLEYLENNAAPSPTPATLTRLTAALGAPPGALAGAGMNAPPGAGRGAVPKPVLHELTRQQCRELVAPGGVGRFLFDEPGRGPVAVPVNFATDGDDVVFRIDASSQLAAAIGHASVSFDVDHLDEAMSEGWSVLLTGTARLITDPVELTRVQKLGVEPWAGGDRDAYVRLAPTQVTGRAIRAA